MTPSPTASADAGAGRRASAGRAQPKSGLYGLFRLDGAPVDPGDAASLGLAAPTELSAAVAQAVDPHAPDAVACADDASGLTVLLGELEEPEALAARLGLCQATPPALLARAALGRFGAEAVAEMIGEWSLLHWERTARRLTLMMSAARRDPLLFGLDGPRVAVAPDIFRMSRLAWIGASLDEAGLLFSWGRVDLRARRGDRTMLSRVRQVEPATCVTLDRDGCRTEAARTFYQASGWRGSFDDAVAEAEQVMRRIIAGRLARATTPAVLLSGGLDSSLLACFAAEHRDEAQQLQLFTSVAPPGSGIPDEIEFAETVASRLGLSVERIWAPPEANIYRPSDAILSGANGPPMSNRHCLTEAFQAAGRRTGATLLVNGTYGEMTLTARSDSRAARRSLRRLAGALYRRLKRPSARAADNPFHVRLAPGRLACLPEPTRAALAASSVEEPGKSPLREFRGVEKALQHANEFYAGALRMDFPYRDQRLLRLFAGFPANLLPPQAADRGLARTMLIDRLPDSVRLRTSGAPAEPDHDARLQLQAPAARARIAAFRKAEVDEWLDLDWLDGALAQIADRGTAGPRHDNEVQLTAIGAEFLTWWRARA